ncbi:MAG: Rieske (2Fe-2S) protein [Actinomycetes bacterium]
MAEPGWAILDADDPIVERRLGVLGDEVGVRWLPVDQTVDQTGRAPVAVVVDLDRSAGVQAVVAWRARYPEAFIVGYLGTPSPQVWVAASRSGADLVTNRGSLVPRLRARIGELTRTGAGLARFPLVEADEVAGRLGLVQAVAETPVGPVAVYQVDARLCAVADVCPHAAGRLSPGELVGGVVTCPVHGSQFDVRTGQRVRGPADSDIAVYRVTVADGYVALVSPR